jgi:hypothetical protein
MVARLQLRILPRPRRRNRPRRCPASRASERLTVPLARLQHRSVVFGDPVHEAVRYRVRPPRPLDARGLLTRPAEHGPGPRRPSGPDAGRGLLGVRPWPVRGLLVLLSVQRRGLGLQSRGRLGARGRSARLLRSAARSRVLPAPLLVHKHPSLGRGREVRHPSHRLQRQGNARELRERRALFRRVAPPGSPRTTTRATGRRGGPGWRSRPRPDSRGTASAGRGGRSATSPTQRVPWDRRGSSPLRRPAGKSSRSLL